MHFFRADKINGQGLAGVWTEEGRREGVAGGGCRWGGARGVLV